MAKLYIDVETYSALDLKKHGAVRYAADKSTGINCIAWAVDDGPVQLFKYEQCQDTYAVDKLRRKLFSKKYLVAHNAQFEMEVLCRISRFYAKPEEWIDTMAKCLYYGYPAGLDDAAKALKCAKLKDIQGKAIMKKLSQPRDRANALIHAHATNGKHGLALWQYTREAFWTPKTAPEDFEKLYEYCKTDVEVCRLIDKALPDLPEQVQKSWMLNAEINARGMPIDVRMVENAIKMKEEIAKANDKHMAWLTNNYVTSVNQSQKIVDFIKTHCEYDVPDCTADTVTRTLQQRDLPIGVKMVFQLRQEAALNSLAKYQKIADFQVDGRLHQMAFWYGAHTGRPTGSGPQMLNLPRSQTAEFWAEIISVQPEFLMGVKKGAEKLKSALRGVICAPEGKTLIGCDLAQIEARATGWLANEQKFLDLFATTDPYCTYGTSLYGRTITKSDAAERNSAKATVLAFGFAGGIGAGQRVGGNYKLDFYELTRVVMPTASTYEIERANENYNYYMQKNPIKPLSKEHAVAVDILKQRYRMDFPLIVQYWDTLENAFLYGGNAGKIKIALHKSGMRIMTLPSGRELFYHNVHVDGSGKYSYQTDKGRVSIWKGVLMENAAQAVNEDISNHYKQLVNDSIGNVVHHCYDEFTCEVEKSNADLSLNELKAITQDKNNKPNWAETLPLGFDYWESRRYGK